DATHAGIWYERGLHPLAGRRIVIIRHVAELNYLNRQAYLHLSAKVKLIAILLRLQLGSHPLASVDPKTVAGHSSAVEPYPHQNTINLDFLVFLLIGNRGDLVGVVISLLFPCACVLGLEVYVCRQPPKNGPLSWHVLAGANGPERLATRDSLADGVCLLLG